MHSSEFRASFEDWIERRVLLRRLNAKSARLYLHYGRAFGRYLALQELDGQPLGPLVVERFVADLGRRRSAHAQRSAYSVLNCFFRRLADLGEIPVNPMIDTTRPKVRRVRRVVPEKKQVVHLLRTIRRSGRAHARRDHALFTCYFYLGLRCAEAANARPEDVDLDRGLFEVFGKGDKPAVLPIPPEALEILRAWMRDRLKIYGRSPWLFPAQAAGRAVSSRPLDGQRIELVLRKHYLPASGIPFRVTPHLLRHAYRRRLRELELGLEDQRDLMRHESLDQTTDYGGECPSQLRGAVRDF